jgi:hypothetical protein
MPAENINAVLDIAIHRGELEILACARYVERIFARLVTNIHAALF